MLSDSSYNIETLQPSDWVAMMGKTIVVTLHVVEGEKASTSQMIGRLGVAVTSPDTWDDEKTKYGLSFMGASRDPFTVSLPKKGVEVLITVDWDS